MSVKSRPSKKGEQLWNEGQLIDCPILNTKISKTNNFFNIFKTLSIVIERESNQVIIIKVFSTLELTKFSIAVKRKVYSDPSTLSMWKRRV